MKPFYLLALLLCHPAMAAEIAPPTACTEIACVDGLTLEVTPDYAWAAGNYVFNFVLDGAAITCRGALPLPSCEQSSIRCDKAGVQITESGCALDPDAQGFGSITIPNAPKQVAVTITHNNKILVQKNFAPHYNTTNPNGKQCVPQCHQAQEMLLR